MSSPTGFGEKATNVNRASIGSKDPDPAKAGLARLWAGRSPQDQSRLDRLEVLGLERASGGGA